MTLPLFHRTPLEEAVAALRDDLIHEDGPRISTMRNYPYAILPYRPSEEFRLRQHVHALSSELRAKGWVVLLLSLQKLLLERLRTVLAPGELEQLIERERRLYAKKQAPERARNYVRDKIGPHLEGPDGLAAEVSREICAFAEAHPDKADHAVAFVGRAGALYPFFRSSALLKHIDGRTEGIPVVLLYPGIRRGKNALSFMGVLPADTDYRPRIYP